MTAQFGLYVAYVSGHVLDAVRSGAIVGYQRLATHSVSRISYAGFSC